MKNRIFILSISTAFLAFIIYRNVNWSNSIFSVVSSCVLYPCLVVQKSIIDPIKIWLHEKKTLSYYETALHHVQHERDELLSENVFLKSALSYVKDIAPLVQFKKRYALEHYCMGNVLARHLSCNNQFFLVDCGTAQGIKKDMIAMYSNCLVGKVVEVYPWYCKICLVSDSECKLGVMSTRTHASGIHEGINESGKTVVRFVSHLDDIAVDDVLVSTGDGFIFPAGFSLGRVSSARKGEIFYEIEVTPSIDFSALRYCMLIAKDAIGSLPAGE